MSCYFCDRDGVKSHAPIPLDLCASCDSPMSDGCAKDHHHDAYAGCFDYQDVRKLWCGCVAHKECQKSGNHCREHGYVPEGVQVP